MVTIISSQPFVQDNLDEPVRGNDQKATHTINIPSENTMGDLIEIRVLSRNFSLSPNFSLTKNSV